MVLPRVVWIIHSFAQGNEQVERDGFVNDRETSRPRRL